jgi:hypothetical protein
VTQRPIVVHDGAPPMGDGQTRPTTFDTLYPLEIRERVIATEAATSRHLGGED